MTYQLVDASPLPGFPILPALLLACRGTDPATLFSPASFAPGSQPDLLLAARLIRQHSRIVIHGDYDADGVCSAAILWHAIRLCTGITPTVVLPSRLHDGYGLSTRHLLPLSPSLVIATDCGISSHEEIATLRHHNIDVLVLDHHTLTSSLPSANVLVHPILGGWLTPSPCAAGLAYALACVLLASPPPYLAALAAIASIADVVPLLGPNRTLVSSSLMPPFGLPGLDALIPLPLTSTDVAFTIAPRINVAGRLGSPTLALELLTSASPSRSQEIIAQLDELNEQRRDLTRSILSSLPPITHHAFAAASPTYHPGIIGVVAGRLAERGIPVAIGHTLPDNRVVGSVRSHSTHVPALLAACASHLQRWGGHAAAGGFTTHPGAWETFAAAFAASPITLPTPTLLPHVRFPCLTIDHVAALAALEPYGAGNPSPLFGSRECLLTSAPRTMGKDSSHLSMTFAQGTARLRTVAFSMADRISCLHPGRFYTLVYEPFINTWQGRSSVQLRLRHFEEFSCPAAASATSMCHT